MKKYLIEGFGTFVWMLLGLGAIYVAGDSNVLSIALIFGATYYVLYKMFHKISGAHFNPAVSFAAFLTKRIRGRELLGYVVSQLVASLVAALLLFGLYLTNTGLKGNVTFLCASFGEGSEIGATFGNVVMFETILSFLLIYAFLYLTSNSSVKSNIALIISGIYTLFFMITFPICNSGLNPARIFGPAVVFGISSGKIVAILQFLVFLVAEVIGTLLAFWAIKIKFNLKLKNRFLKIFTSIKNCYKKYFDFKGRETRFEFWCFAFFTIIINFFAWRFNLEFVNYKSTIFLFLSIVFDLAGLLSLIPFISVSVRRFHDTGKSGWFFLILLIPIVGLVLFIVWMAKASDDKNKYGQNLLKQSESK